jgi:hypothetical protein
MDTTDSTRPDRSAPTVMADPAASSMPPLRRSAADEHVNAIEALLAAEADRASRFALLLAARALERHDPVKVQGVIGGLLAGACPWAACWRPWRAWQSSREDHLLLLDQPHRDHGAARPGRRPAAADHQRRHQRHRRRSSPLRRLEVTAQPRARRCASGARSSVATSSGSDPSGATPQSPAPAPPSTPWRREGRALRGRGQRMARARVWSWRCPSVVARPETATVRAYPLDSAPAV